MTKIDVEKAANLSEEVYEEFLKASSKFPAFVSEHEGYAILLEEVDELWEAVKLNLVAGFLLGVIAALVIPMILHISPIYVDCGCGAQAEMARQCFDSGNLSSWQCGVFR